jgi:hypothetical protein
MYHKKFYKHDTQYSKGYVSGCCFKLYYKQLSDFCESKEQIIF